MSRPRSYPLLLIAGALLLILVVLFFLTHRPLEPLPDSPVSETVESSSSNALPAIDEPAPAETSLASAPTAAALAEKLSTRLTRPDTRAHEAVLIFKTPEGYQRFLARATEAGVIVTGQIDALNTLRVRVRAYDTFAADLLARAADYGGISANTFVTLPPPPGERVTGRQLAVGNTLLATVGVPDGTDNSAWGRGITLAILDGGALPDPTLGARLRYLDIGLGYAGTGASARHGAAVASLAAGSAADAPGIAPAATVLSIRVIDTDDKSDVFTVTRGIVAAVDAGARVINLSLGGYSTSEILNRAIAYAEDHGAVIVAAAGNDGANRLTWPAADPHVVSVGSTDAAGRLASFSNSGPQLRLTAPGVGIQAAAPANERTLFSGTSASAPVVAGALAALLSQSPGLTPAQAVEILQTHANDGGPAGADSAYGSGTLNLGWALARADTTRTDTAIAGYFYNPDTGSLEVIVQNRSARPAANLTLNVDLNGQLTPFTVAKLAPGQSLAVPIPLDPTSTTAPLTLRTRLDNPDGITDAVPANNSRSSLIDLTRP